MSWRRERRRARAAGRIHSGWRGRGGGRQAGRLGAFAVAVLLGLATAAERASAWPPPPQDLRVDGGEEAWHAGNSFRVRWSNPSQVGAPLIVATHYRVRSPSGAMLSEGRIGFAETRIEELRVPSAPGIYTAEVWLEDAAQRQGPPASVKLRFDNARPANVEPLPRAAWISRTEQPYTIRIAPPAGPAPASGIRGYAVSIDRAATGISPCQGGERCTDAETDLRGGAGDNSLPVAELPEGTSYVHAVAVSGSGMRSAAPGRTTLRVDKTDPSVRLAGAPSGWTNRPVSLFATATDALSGMRATGTGDGPFTAIGIDGAAPAIAAGDSVHTAVIEPGVHTISYYARDAAGNVNDGGRVNGQANHPPSTATVRIDRDAPQVAFANFQDPNEPEAIEARVTDSLAGPHHLRGEIAVRRAGSDDRFEALPTTAGSTLRARWDSDAHPPGQYEFRATAFDAAGNPAATTRRANGKGMLLSSPLKIAMALNAGFGGRTMVWHRCARRGGAMRCRREATGELERRPTRRLVRYGRGTAFSGRLVAGARAPLAHAQVLVIERFDPGASQRERVTPVSTSADGAFVARLGPGPSREVTAVFEGSRTLSRAASKAVRLEVRGGVRLRASARTATVGGRPVVFQGRALAGDATIPVRGRTVQLQFRLPGVPWTEFRTVQTDARGRFRHAYRFSDDDSRGVRFQFRAFLPAQEGWPYQPAGSLPVAVLGR